MDIVDDPVVSTEEETVVELPTVDVSKPHPHLLMVIVTTTLAVVEEQSSNEVETLYLVTKEYLRVQHQTLNRDAAVAAFFTYYIESYRALQQSKKAIAAPEGMEVSPPDAFSYNEAALSLLDLYLLRPTDILVRRMAAQAVMSLTEIIITIQGYTEEHSAKDQLGHLSGVAIMAQSVRDYMRGIRRKENYAYMRWLREFLARATSTRDLSFMNHDEVLKDVLGQLTRRERVITLPFQS